jgi:NAD(P)-dependent dehydrogenase (short-subunit alcohol dehydrogenase family)
MTSPRLAGKRAIITGAGSGIGRAAALLFCREGARVGIIDCNEAGAAETAALIADTGGEAAVFIADVTNEEQIAAAVRAVSATWGGLDVLIANAGIAMVGRDDRVDRIELDVWQRIIDVNLTGMFLTCKHGIRALLESGGGAVVCTTSPTGLYGIGRGQDAYSASKAGVYGLIRVMAAEYGPEQIRVNGVMPGYIKTPLTTWVTAEREQQFGATVPIGRAGRAEEIANVMAFLASDEASYVTGAVWAADGGWTAV